MAVKHTITEPTILTVTIPSGNDVLSVIRNAVRFCKSFTHIEKLCFLANGVPMRVDYLTDEDKAITSFKRRYKKYNK